MRRRAGGRRERRRAGHHRLHGAGHWRDVEGAVVDRAVVPHGSRPLDVADQLLSQRHGQRRYLAGIHGRGLRHRPAHRRCDVCRRRALVAGARAAAVDPGPVHPGALPADSRQRVEALGDVGRPDLERLHPLHRRRRRAGGWLDHPGPDAAHHPGQLQGKHEGAGRRRRRRHGPHRTGPAAGRRPARHAGAGHLPRRRSGPADARAPAGRRADHPVRLLLRQRLVAHHGPDRQLVEPDLGHDHRDADPDVHGICGDRLDRATSTRPSPSASARWSASRRPSPGRRRRT